MRTVQRIDRIAGFVALSAWSLVLLAGCNTSSPPPARTSSDKPQTTSDKPRILFVTQSKGYEHGSVKRGTEGQLSPAEIAITQLAQSSGAFSVNCTQDAGADFTRENLQNYDIVWFYTTTTPSRDGKEPVRLPIPQDVLDYFLNDWLKQNGHGFIGSHSATDTYHDYEPYWDMIGGTFKAHPWNASETVTITVHEPHHPVAFGWGSQFQIKDEIYEYSHWQPEKVRVIMSLNMAECKTRRPYHVPVAWVKKYGDGRVYYNNLGHNPETWTNPTFQQSLVQAIAWVAGRINDATPNPEVSKAEEEKAKAAATADAEKTPQKT